MVPPNTASFATGGDGLTRVVQPVGSPGQAVVAGACPPTIDASAVACGAAAVAPSANQMALAEMVTLIEQTAGNAFSYSGEKPSDSNARQVLKGTLAQSGLSGIAKDIVNAIIDAQAPLGGPVINPYAPGPYNQKAPAPALAMAMAPDRPLGDFFLAQPADDGFPAVPHLADSTRDGGRPDPVTLPAELAWLAPALGGAAVGPGTPTGDIPPSAFVALESAVTSSAPAEPPGRLGMPMPVDAIMGRSWQPMPDEPIGTTSAGPPGDASTARRASASYTTTAPRPAIRSGRYLVIGSFLTFRHAERLAARHRGIAAVVIPTVIDGKTWHRVAVPEPTRGRLSDAGITDFWVLGR